MLIAAENSSGVQLVGSGFGDFAGTASVQQLQEALLSLSMAAGWTAANPGPITGDVSLQTISAIAAVVAKLGGKISSSVKTAVQLAAVGAAFDSTLRGAAQVAIAAHANELRGGVLALTAIYTKSSAPPIPPAPPAKPLLITQFMMKSTTPSAAQTAPLPPGSVQAQTKAGIYRVAVPASQAVGLGGPSVSLGEAFKELPARQSFTPGVILVSEGDLKKKTGEAKPFWKKPMYWAIVGGVVVVGGGAYTMIRRR